MRVMPALYRATGTHTSSTVASVTNVTVADPAQGLLVQAISQNIRFTFDGTAPTTTLGFRITAGNDPIFIPVPPGTVVRFLEETSAATLQYVQVRTLDNN